MFKGIVIRIDTTERPHGDDFSHFQAELRYKFASDYIKDNSDSILDIGCGEGDFPPKKWTL